MEKKLKNIKEIILRESKSHGIEVEKVMLFGSRARGESNDLSDYDLLIITNNKISRMAKWELQKKLRQEITKITYEDKKVIGTDIIMISKNDVPNYAGQYWSAVGNALKEGITL